MLNRVRWWVSMLLIGGLLAVATESAVGAPKQKPRKRPPAPAATEKSDPDATKDKPAIESDQLKAGSYHGQLVSAPNEGGLFRVAVEYQRVRVKRGKEAEYDRIQKDSVNQAAKATANQTKAVARAQLTPLYRGRVSLPDRSEISGSLGAAAGSVAMLEGNNALLKGLLETVSDTQTVIFHAAPKVQVRVLKGSVEPLDPSLSTAQSEVEKVKQDRSPLPGHEGAMRDLQVGQRIMLKLAAANNEGGRVGIAPGSIYKRLVALLVVEEEAEAGSSSK